MSKKSKKQQVEAVQKTCKRLACYGTAIRDKKTRGGRNFMGKTPNYVPKGESSKFKKKTIFDLLKPRSERTPIEDYQQYVDDNGLYYPDQHNPVASKYGKTKMFNGSQISDDITFNPGVPYILVERVEAEANAVYVDRKKAEYQAELKAEAKAKAKAEAKGGSNE